MLHVLYETQKVIHPHYIDHCCSTVFITNYLCTGQVYVLTMYASVYSISFDSHSLILFNQRAVLLSFLFNMIEKVWSVTHTWSYMYKLFLSIGLFDDHLYGSLLYLVNTFKSCNTRIIDLHSSYFACNNTLVLRMSY